jgi:uncharacterized protein (DUF433 family)
VATAYITRNEAAQLSGASVTAVNKAIEQRTLRTKQTPSGAVIDARDVAALRVFATLPFGLPVTTKRKVADWLRDAPSGAEFVIGDAVYVRSNETVQEALQGALRYVELRDRFLEVSPGMQGGEPVIRGTRVPIRGLAKQIEAGEKLEVLREEYDYIDPDAFEFTVVWAKANPRRGRPSRPWKTDEGEEPSRRRELIAQRAAAATTA